MCLSLSFYLHPQEKRIRFKETKCEFNLFSCLNLKIGQTRKHFNTDVFNCQIYASCKDDCKKNLELYQSEIYLLLILILPSKYSRWNRFIEHNNKKIKRSNKISTMVQMLMIIYICCIFWGCIFFFATKCFLRRSISLFAGSHPAIFDRVESMLCCDIVMWYSCCICWMNLEEIAALNFLIVYAILQSSKVNLSWLIIACKTCPTAFGPRKSNWHVYMSFDVSSLQIDKSLLTILKWKKNLRSCWSHIQESSTAGS